MKCCCNTIVKEEILQKTPVTICPNCGLIQKKEILSAEEEKKRYDYHQCDQGYKEYMQCIFLRLKPWIQGKCLDYGCGQIHYFADILNEEGFSCDYYDLYYYPIPPKGLFDTIILIEVFEHLANPYQEMKRLEKLLKPDGRIIIMTKPYEGQDLDTWWYFRDQTHISFIRTDTIKKWELEVQFIEVNDDIFILERI